MRSDMITEDFCSFEVAKLLKEKGFDELCIFKYNSEGVRMKAGVAIDKWQNSELDDDECSCVSHQMAMKWLREEKGFHIVSSISYDTSVDADGNEVDRWIFYFFEILSSYSGNLIYTEEMNEYDSYEEAVEAALKYCLEKLI